VGRLGGLVCRLVLNALALLIIARLGIGVQVSGIGAALGAALAWGLANALLRPVLLVLSLPLNLCTLGLFTLVVNGLLFWLVAALGVGLTVSGFWPALLGALLLSVLSAILSFVVGL
jgi:putative membrane protein